MKRKIIFLSLVFIFSASVVFAQGTGGKNDNTGNPELMQEDKENNQESDQESQQDSDVRKNQSKQHIKARNTEELKEMIINRKQAMDQVIKTMKDKKQQKIYQNQNTVREAVHALLSMEDLLTTEELVRGNSKGIGPQVSAIAREFNNSVDKTIQAEEKIQKRNKLVKFFFGGDEEAAENILQETNKNQEKIQQLKNLYQDCDCDAEVKNIIQEQIQNIEREQNRLGQLAQKEKSNKRIFGWLFGWMKK